MENLLNVLTRPLPIFTLQDLSLIKLATTLSNNEQLLDLIMDIQGNFETRLYARNGKKWKKVQSLAKKLLLNVSKCVKINNMVIEFLWTATYRIIFWRSTHAPSIRREFLRHFYWTLQGQIDNERTARSIIENKDVPITERFKVACSLCLKEQAQELWLQMTDTQTQHLLNRLEEKMHPLLLIWMGILVEVEIDHDCLVDALECATKLGLLDAVKYLLTITAESHQSDVAILCYYELTERVNKCSFLEENDLEIGCLLFSKIIQDNQRIVFNFRDALTLSLILHSSEREYFLGELASRLPHLSTSVIETLLYIIFYNYHLGIRNEFDYQELFTDVWRLIPESVKYTLKSNTDFGMHFLDVLIKEEYQYITKKNLGNIDSFGEFAFASNLLLTPECFEEDRWIFLYFLIKEEIVTNTWLKRYEYVFLNFIEKRKLPSLLQKNLKKILSKMKQL